MVVAEIAVGQQHFELGVESQERLQQIPAQSRTAAPPSSNHADNRMERGYRGRARSRLA